MRSIAPSWRDRTERGLSAPVWQIGQHGSPPARVSRKAGHLACVTLIFILPGKLLGFFAGGIATAAGYGGYFVISVLAVLPAMLLFACLWPRFRSFERERAAAEGAS